MPDLRMPDLNTIVIAGRLTRDVDLRYTAGKKAVAKGSIANTRYWYDQAGARQEDTLFIDVTLWGDPAEKLAEWGKKGAPVLIEGRLRANDWEDQQGATHRRIEITAQRVAPLAWDGEKPARRETAASSSGNGGGSNGGGGNRAGRPEPSRPDVTEEDVPF